MGAKIIHSEKVLERNLQKRLKEIGGKAYKFTSPNCTGVPDRLVIFKGRFCFAEIKSTGGKLSPRQVVEINKLESLGAKTFIVYTPQDIEKIINFITDERK